jgi:hypothetical protein
MPVFLTIIIIYDFSGPESTISDTIFFREAQKQHSGSNPPFGPLRYFSFMGTLSGRTIP